MATTKEGRDTDELSKWKMNMKQTSMCNTQKRMQNRVLGVTDYSSTSASIKWEGGRRIGRQEVAVGMIAAEVKSRVAGERTVVEEAQSHCG